MTALRSRARLAGFDGLRAVAALSVLVYHLDFFAPTSPHWIRSLLQQLRLGVWIFFVLSGFLLYRGWAASHLDGSAPPRLGKYFRNRTLRIFPAYWAALLFFTAIHNTALNPAVGIAGVIRQFTLTQTYFRRDTVIAYGLPRGLPQTWSLAVELSFYLALPLYAWCTGWAGRRIGALRAESAGIVLLVGGWVAWTIETRGNALHQQWLPNFAMAFGAGIALAVLGTALGGSTVPGRFAQRSASCGPWLWAGAMALVLVRSRLNISHENGLQSQVLYTAIAVLVVLPVALADHDKPLSALVRTLDSTPARFLGRVSYGIFLWHYLLIRSIRDEWLHAPTGDIALWRMAAVVVPFTLLAATASWYLIERPLSRPAGAMRFSVSLTVVAAGALAWRVFYVLTMIGRIPNAKGDAAYYHYQAAAIAKGLGFIDPFQWHNSGVITPSAGHPPAYLLYLAAFTKLGAGSWTAHRLASCLLGALMVVFIGLAGRELAGERVGIIAALLGAGYAHLFINDEMLMSESMAALAVAVVMWAMVRAWKQPTTRRCVALGAAIGFGALSRAELLMLVPLFVVPLLLRRSELSLRTRATRASCAVGVAALLVAPWVGYNLSRFHHPVYMSNGVGGVALVGNCDQTYNGPLLGYWYVGCGAKYAGDLQGDESDRELRWRTAGFHYLTTHLDRFPVVAAARAGRMWDVFRPSQNTSFNGTLEGRGIGASQLAIREYFALLPLAAIGLWLLRRRRMVIWPFVALAGLVTVTAVTSFGVTRYRVPVDVCLPMLAAVTIGVGYQWLSNTWRPRTS